MSATNRGSERKEYDRYITPDYTIKSLIDNFKFEGLTLECCAGYGDISKKIKNCITMDIDASLNCDITANFLDFKPSIPINNIVTNPPYSIAIEIIKHALDIIENNGYVVMLLRINFLESKTRKQFFIDNPLHSILILSKRPCFINNRSDATGYAWFIWQKGKKDKSVIVDFV